MCEKINIRIFRYYIVLKNTPQFSGFNYEYFFRFFLPNHADIFVWMGKHSYQFPF